jgi:hypothetical protein
MAILTPSASHAGIVAEFMRKRSCVTTQIYFYFYFIYFYRGAHGAFWLHALPDGCLFAVLFL